MHPYGYDEDYLMKLEYALKCLPNIKPRKARALLKEWQEVVFSQMTDDIFSGREEKDIYEYDVGSNIVVTSNDFDHLLYDDGYSAIKITPEGAEILINAYQNGLFELQARKCIEAVSDEIFEYSKSKELILEKQKIDATQRAEELKKYQFTIQNPHLVDHKSFTYKLLNDIFIKKFGLKGGSYSMEVGGILVTKSVNMYTSNSGKSRDSEVTFSWENSQGEIEKLKKQSLYSDNRRSDPERNWGLHE